MFDVLFAACLALLIIESAHAQVSAPNCTVSTFNGSTAAYAWSYNSLGQSPCLVAAYLAAVCSNGTYSIPSLLPQYSYDGPNATFHDNTCLCNTVTYNLYSACATCQEAVPTHFRSWSNNCDSVADPGTLTDSIPAQTRIPHWAYLDPTVNGSDFWNESLAQSVGDSPEVTGTFFLAVPSSTGNVPSSTSDTTASQTIQPEPVTGSGSVSSRNIKSNSGAIAGGVVGVALITGLVALFTIHRRRRHALSADHISGRVVPYPIEIERLRLYDPSDPSTYPKSNRRLYHSLPDI